jgi:exodeoxyribonuclease VII large subunit
LQGSGLPIGDNGYGSDDAGGALVARSAPGDNSAPVSVSDLSQALKRLVEQGFGHVRVRGEISGFKRAASGHLYMALKDADALIDAVMWKGAAARIPFRAEDGLDVIATGRITTYPGRSKYQIVVDSLELAGEGALLALLEKTKARLAAEGLFAPERKLALPSMPRIIGVVTSPTGAVIRDILHRLADRFPTRVIVWPVLVQGPGAAEQVAAAIAGFDALGGDGPVPRPDLVIVARGGGAIEDLWAFNEEIVVRAVAACRIPLISAVGHETDTTLIDFVSDRRAPTPTAAAEMAVPVRADLVAQLADLAARSARGWARIAGQQRERIDAAAARLPGLDRLVAPQRQRLDDWSERLPQALALTIARVRQSYAHSAAALRPALIGQRIDNARDRVAALWRLAGSLDPRALLARGYAMVSAASGQVLTSAAAARKAGRLTLTFADDAVAVEVVEGPRAPSAPPARKGKPAMPGQGGLFD